MPRLPLTLGDRAWWPAKPQAPVGQEVGEPEPAYALSSR